ncbi:MAG: TonB family protein [Chitinophagaceae bacterium]|nr:MAG: TonB family protein [Chitinophagaceae bacterium]
MITAHFILFNVYLAGWLGLYLILFNKTTGFKMNRLILLSGILVAFILPIIHIHWTPYSYAGNSSALISLAQPAYNVGSSPSVSSRQYVAPFPVWKTIEIIYWCGVMVMSFLFIQKFIRFFFFIKGLPHHVEEDHIRIITGSDHEVFSFGKYLFAPADISPAIYQHELVHIRERHTLDNLLLEIVKIFCWFNPAVYWYQNVLRTLHEYMADSVVTRSFEKGDYARLLTSHTFFISSVAFTNHFFNRSQLQKRLIMLHKQNTPQKAGRKYLLIVPLVAVLIIISVSSFTLKNKVNDIISELSPSGQSLDVKGVVTDQYGNPVARATVTMFNTHKGTITNDKGQFEINNVSKGGLLVVSMIGYSTIHLQIDSEKKLYLTLYSNPSNLNEVIVTGYSIAKGHPIEKKSPGSVFVFVEQNPSFPGGKEDLMRFLQHNIQYPQEARKEQLQGTVVVSFVVNKDGSLTQIHTIGQTIGGGLEQEAMRVVKVMPKWIPGHQNGETVTVPYTLPIRFVLQ